eukprot:11211681-Lingulodinium_polyedra.AAC.1
MAAQRRLFSLEDNLAHLAIVPEQVCWVEVAARRPARAARPISHGGRRPDDRTAWVDVSHNQLTQAPLVQAETL